MATKRVSSNPRALRKKLGMNQQQFWASLGVTQSGGSRYETGRTMPKSVRMLMELAHGAAAVDDIKTGKLAARV
jgi:transcriptional regulator with XRE-family HTH domain